MEGLLICPGYSFSLTQQQLTVNDVTVATQGEGQFPARAVPRLSARSPLICAASVHVSSSSLQISRFDWVWLIF